VVSAIQKGGFSYSKESFQLFKRVVSAIQKGRFSCRIQEVASAIQKGRFSYPKLSVKNFF
jgi:hypothetical protein